MSFLASQVTVAVAAVLLITLAHAWAATGHFFATLSAAWLTCMLAVLAAALLGGGWPHRMRTRRPAASRRRPPR